jgi:hypothetical protein
MIIRGGGKGNFSSVNLRDVECSKSPFSKGGFRGIYKPLKSPLSPLFKRGGTFAITFCKIVSTV